MYSLGTVNVRVAVTSPVAGSYAVIVSVVSSELYSVDAMTMPRRGAVDGSAAADAVPCAPVVEAEELDGVEDAPQAVRRRALVAVAMRMVGIDLMDMCHLVSVIVGWRTLQDSCELTNKASSKK